MVTVHVLPSLDVESQPLRPFALWSRDWVRVTTVPAGNDAVQTPVTVSAELAQLIRRVNW